MNLSTDEASLPFYDAARIAAALPFDTLISALRESFASGDAVPMRHHHTIEQAGAPPATLLLMPAWRDGHLGVKLVNVFPGNAVKGLPALHSVYLLFDGTDGRPVALLDGNEITGRRTVATAALAASYLARADASSLLLIGAGRVAALTASAMRAVRPVRRVLIWNRSRPKADALMEQLRREGFETEYAADLRAAIQAADIVSCATLAAAPLVKGAWLRPGVHVDLIGGFTPTMREVDTETIRRADVFVDSPTALAEAGDLLEPIREGILTGDQIVNLSGLCRLEHPGRQGPESITLFKAVGTAGADLAAAVLVKNHERFGRERALR